MNENDLTQVQAARQIGISQAALSLLLRGGEARPETYRKISQATGGALSPNVMILGDPEASDSVPPEVAAE